MSRRAWFLGLAGCLFIAAVLSGVASSHPDGLEFVAERLGFGDSATDSPVAGGPLADYATRGVADPWVSGGVAGVIGVLVVAALAFGLTWALRRRTRA